MSEVRKYKAIGDMTPRSRVGGGEWVRLEDYDTALSQLAALREELLRLEEEYDTLEHSNITIKQCLTAAEQRNANLTALLQRVVDSSVLSFEQDAPEELESLEVDICAALKPTESGASE